MPAPLPRLVAVPLNSRLRAGLRRTADRCRADPPSPARERLHDDDFVRGGERLRQVARLLAVDEDADVAPDAVLLVDDAKADARVLAFEVGEQRGEGRAARLGLAAFGVGEKGAGNQDLHRVHRSAAVSTA